MAVNGCKWHKIAGKLEIAEISWKWLECLQMAVNGCTWLYMVDNGWKWLFMAGMNINDCK